MNLFERLKELRAKKKELEEKRCGIVEEIRSLAKEKKEEEARSKALEREKIEARMEIIEEEIESVMTAIDEERKNTNFTGGRVIINGDSKEEKRSLQLSAMSKTIRGIQLSEEERDIMSSTNNGAVIPQEFVNEFEKLKEGYPSLKEHCHVIPVNRNAGKMPVRAGASVDKLANLAKDTELVKAMLKTQPMAYDIDDYGLLAPIDNSLLEDSEINFLEFVNEEFAEFAVNTENAEIVKQAKAVLAEETINDYAGLVKTINSLVPNARKRAIIVTNSDGRAYLDGLMDKQGRPLLKELSDGGDLVFKGRPVIELEESIFDVGDETKFIVSDFKTLIKFMDRKQYLIDQSKEAGYTKNETIARIIERFDVNSPLDKSSDAEKIRKFGVIVKLQEVLKSSPRSGKNKNESKEEIKEEGEATQQNE
ncbi:phage major capsid protein [Clostridium perfringens]|uniref:Phage major capsid protein n=3 Tax=root TaxID=1 RepID=A0AAP7BW93_CLOPF|nr:phage major capsid protein [Clostridium perfringens]NP_612835.1 major capsid protein [Clostridium phage phi3626]AAL96776.1 major capsid protein [Clostridium phage phi3626]EDT22893.1 phage major capsid protein, HK97 family [Clostridium perfringens B str. ATCC 3626]NGU30608.1 phage major capsid protein [Clostridium perfringens]WEV05021.1 phage major capsid protein [Clostridium perfringens B]